MPPYASIDIGRNNIILLISLTSFVNSPNCLSSRVLLLKYLLLHVQFLVVARAQASSNDSHDCLANAASLGPVDGYGPVISSIRESPAVSNADFQSHIDSSADLRMATCSLGAKKNISASANASRENAGFGEPQRKLQIDERVCRPISEFGKIIGFFS
jgi:hypothetical protein